MLELLNEIRSCKACEEHLPQIPNPVLQAGLDAKIILIGQAPGTKVHQSGIPWDDKSGDELRRWLGVDKEQFYDEKIFALIPMGFCYPGKGASGDLPPRKECAPLWHEKLFQTLKQTKLKILVGKYAQKYYLGGTAYSSLTENVKYFRQFLPEFLPLVHPSPRNRIWQKKHPWFEEEVIPEVRGIVRKYF